MTRIRRMTAFLGALALAVALPASAATWDIDSTHSSASFSVRHLMISTVRGNFKAPTGTIEWDGKDPASVKIDTAVDVSTINTSEPKRDAHLKSADFFDVEKFPKMTFKSKKATSVGPNKLKVVGDLTMHGVTKEATFDVEFTPQIKDPWGNDKFGATATATIDRTAYGLTWNKALETGGVMVSTDVSITIDAELSKKPEPAAEKK